MKIYVAILLSLFSYVLVSQTPAYLHYGVEDGLPSTMVYCAIQDKKGFMWFGTDNGLVRFDGSRFKVYTMADGLPDPEVLDLFEDSSGRLWMSCFQKKPCFMKDGIIHTSENDSLLDEFKLRSGVYFFAEDDQKAVWITGGDKHTCRIIENRVECFTLQYPEDRDPVRIKDVGYFDNKIVFGGRVIYDLSDTNNLKVLYASKFKNKSNFPRTISYHSDKIFYTNGDFLNILGIENDEIVEIERALNLPSGWKNITSPDGQLVYLSYPTAQSGAYLIQLSSDNTILQKKNFLKGKQVSAIFRDNDNTVWFTTMNDGIFAMSEKTTLVFNKGNSPIFNDNNITALSLLPDKTIIIGNSNGKIYTKKKGEPWEEVNYKINMEPSLVRQIITMSDSTWIGVLNRYLYAEKNGSFIDKFKVFTRDESGNYLQGPKYGFNNNDELWVASLSGLSYWDSLQYHPHYVIINKRFTAVGSDHEGNIWAGGIGGLLSERDSFQVNLGKTFPPVGGRIIDIKQSISGYLWVATAEYGLLRVSVSKGEVKEVEILHEKVPIPAHGIKSLYTSDDHTIWMATKNGVYKLDKNFNVEHYNQVNGLPNNDVNAVVVENDTLWVATVAGLAKVQLNQNMSDESFPTYISGVEYELDGKEINLDMIHHNDEVLKIPAGASMIDIQLSGLHFISGSETTYQYIVKEKYLPLRWITWGNLWKSSIQKISLRADTLILNEPHRNLGARTPAGNFETEVVAMTKDGMMSPMPDMLMISILPYWYETIWFSLVVATIVGLLLWRFYQQRTAMRRFQRAASELQLQAIKAQINPHFVGNSINAIQQFFYPPDPLRASQYISTFTSLLRQTMHLSEVPFVPFQEEIDFITAYLEMVKLRFEDRFEYSISHAVDMSENILFPAMILQPLLENATIHGLAPEGVSRMNVDFLIKGKILLCSVEDNGVGIETSKALKKSQSRKRVSKGIGLLRKKIEVLNRMHGLDIKIEFQDLSTLGGGRHGTKVVLSFSPEKIPSLSAISE